MALSRRTFLRAAAGGLAVPLAGCSSGTEPSLSVPDAAAIDEPVSVAITGLDPDQDVTLRSRARSRDGRTWVARARFRADANGRVSVAGQRPRGGSDYDRADPTGPFWAMRPADLARGDRPAPDVRFVPPRRAYDVRLAALVDGQPVAAATTTRRLHDPEITALRIDRDGIVGWVFEPPGTGRAPAVVHLHGASGRPLRWAGRLLASRGYLTATPRYFGDEPSLPDALREVPVEYVTRTVAWLRRHERADGGPVGLVGYSRGGTLALLAGSRSDAVGAVVGWVPSTVAYEGLDPGRVPAGASAWSVDGDPVPYLELAEPDPGVPPTAGLPYFEPPLDAATPGQLARVTVPLADVDAPMYLASATDDRRWPSTRLCERATTRLAAVESDHEVRHDAHEGAGHFRYPPTLPTAGTTRTGRNRYGGTPTANARANAATWRRTVSVLDQALGAE
jgi:nucleolar protein 56